MLFLFGQETLTGTDEGKDNTQMLILMETYCILLYCILILYFLILLRVTSTSAENILQINGRNM